MQEQVMGMGPGYSMHVIVTGRVVSFPVRSGNETGCEGVPWD